MQRPTIYVLFAVLAISSLCAHAKDSVPAGAEAATLIERIEALEAQTTADRAVLSSQSKQIDQLKADLNSAREAAAAATKDASDAANKSLKATRKEIYTDMSTIIVHAVVPEKYWAFDQSHMHDVLADQAGYHFGIRNGHRANGNAGTYRLMPKALQQKCDQIKAEQ